MAKNSVVTGVIVDTLPSAPPMGIINPQQLRALARQQAALAAQRPTPAHRKRCLVLALAVHLAALVLCNALVWALYVAIKSCTTSRPHTRGGYTYQVPVQAPYVLEDQYSVPWPVWVTFSTVVLFVGHLVNTAPFIFLRSGCPPWNYWVVANLGVVVILSWCLFFLYGGPQNEEFPWPWVVTAMSLVAAFVSTAADYLCRFMNEENKEEAATEESSSSS